MKELIVKGRPARPGAGWGYTGGPSKAQHGHTVARAIAAARIQPDVVVIMEDASVSPDRLIELALSRCQDTALFAGFDKTGRPFVTASEAFARELSDAVKCNATRARNPHHE